MTFLSRDFILRQRSTHFWNIDYTPIPGDLAALGSLVPDLNDTGITCPLAQYLTNGDTVFVGCNLRRSGFIDRIPKGSTECNN